MSAQSEPFFFVVQGHKLEVQRIAGSARTLVFLHEGLGSVAMWRDFPARVAQATGCSAIVYSRYGYGQSEVLEAPHVFVEDISVASIAEAKTAFQTTDLPQKLGRYHADAAKTFWGWNDIWLHPDFRAWNIEDRLPKISCPVLAIQGFDDEYGTMAQLEAIARQAGGPVELLRLASCRHSPHRDQPAVVIEAMSRFIDRLEGGA